MSQVFYFRRLQRKDSRSFFNLRLEALQKAPASYLSSYEDTFKGGEELFAPAFEEGQEENVVFGVFTGENLVGVTGIYQEAKSKLKHKCTIWGVYVQPDYRQQKLARKLMEMAIQHAKTNIQCAIVNLTVETKNLAAKKLYESLGFVVWGTELRAIQFDGIFCDEYHMSLHFE